MAEPTEVVGVLRIHLEQMLAAFDWSKGYFGALDLADQYRKGSPQARPARITALHQQCFDRLEAYLFVEEVEDE